MLLIPNTMTQLQIKIQMAILLSLQNKVKEISLHLLKPHWQAITSIINRKILLKKAKLFKSTNWFEILNQLDEPDLNSSSQQLPFEQNNDISDEVFKPPPPIFVRGVVNYLDLCTALIELIGVDNFFCKTSADRLKIQTRIPNHTGHLFTF